MTVDQDKEAIRERIWTLLEAERVVPRGVHGKIPNFYGADQTAERLAERAEWQRSRVLKANPDRAQLPVRVRALQDRKLLYMAVPRMATIQPFYELDPERLDVSPEAAAEVGGAGEARRVGADDMKPIDAVICGSVAVNRSGARIGKGAGYADLETALLIEAGLVTDKTVIIAPVHQLQVVEDDLPTTEHDFHVDLIVTPDEVIECARSPRPTGLVWEHLSPEKIAAIPVLAAQAKARQNQQG
jgi:5-formyltetrahydrofolate cyclo-ligase